MPIKSIFKNIFVLLLLLISSESFSQTQYIDAKFFTGQSSYKNSDSILIAAKVYVKEKYHMNSYEVSDPTLIPTSISSSSDNFAISKIYYPKDELLKFEFSSTQLRVYQHEIIIGILLKPKEGLAEGNYSVPLQIGYQACDDKVCYPPKTWKDSVQISVSAKGDSKAGLNSLYFSKIQYTFPQVPTAKTEGTKNTTKLTENPKTSNPDEEQVTNIVEEKGLALALIFIFLGGLALNLTPCVYPLIPITVSYFGAQVSGSKSQSVMMGVFYALGMSVTYSSLGVFAALTGGLLGTALQNPFVIAGVALILIALGTSMFGLFEIRVPQKLALMGNKNRSGYVGSLVMGLTVGFIAAPCIGPFVLSLLVYVGKTGSAFMGFLLFFVLSLGLGVPYIFLAASSSSLSKLPRSGAWMEGVKTIFGLILFGMALNTLAPIFGKHLFALIYPIYLIAAGIYLAILDKKGSNSTGFSKFKTLIALLAVFYGAWILKPNEGKEEVKWKNLTSVEQISSSVSSDKKPVMIDFYADWCAQCKELDEYTYTDKEIIDLSSKLNTIKIDLTKENEAISNKYNIKGLPVVLFMNSKGEEITGLRVTGFLKPSEFKQKITKLLESEK
ncbi:MAG: protein-disulfide reductase DsbD [Bacteroidetes bacterium]|nr:protein-disulfide reductase DsbD [Bacteroidota bacterium]